MYHDHPHDATHRHETTTMALLRALVVRLAPVAALPLALWAVAHPLAALLALAVLAVLAWHRRVARPPRQPAPRPTRPPD